MIRLGLTGFPLGHSLSPRLHNAALRHAGLTGEYTLYPVDPADPDGLAALLGRVRSGELTGLNVTVPHKQRVIPLLDALTETARRIGAVNTIYLRDGRLVGDNTDSPGFAADLGRFLSQAGIPFPQTALVLGAGGSARAVLHALRAQGWQVWLHARRPEQARALADDFGIAHSQLVVDIHTLPGPEIGLIVNTTPVGMFPHVTHSPWPPEAPFPPGAAVYDLVYNPPETLLVRAARAAGFPAVTGLGMLIEQAALAFEIWTGCAVRREALWQALELDPYPFL